MPVEAFRIPPAPPTSSTRITVPFGSGGFGFAVATRPLALRVTVAVTRAFVVRLRSRNVDAVTPVTGRSNVTVTFEGTLTFVAPPAGVRALTVGVGSWTTTVFDASDTGRARSRSRPAP